MTRVPVSVLVPGTRVRTIATARGATIEGPSPFVDGRGPVWLKFDDGQRKAVQPQMLVEVAS